MPTDPHPSAGFEYVVAPGDTARALGSGEVDVLGTPRLLALVEQATLRATRGLLAEDRTSVGVRVELEHLLAVPVGERVRVSARLAGREDRRLLLEVRVTDARDRLVAVGRMTRAVVRREGFGRPGRNGQPRR